ncbi:hypothetical protein B0H17DRAFT_1284977 [Mycena rosella]|uniref:Uncharacterized protein n=1 Tax=Mycena rosella TaxID=1033263 RepID=A0AAD7BSQ7_MYCRO|nr:hypothetical protein B0H17DRAFT_1284977 [Mycena rosella]
MTYILLFVESMYHSAIISIVAWSLRDSNLSVLSPLLSYYAPASVSRSFDSRTSDLSRLHPRNRPNCLLALSEGTYAHSTHVTAASESYVEICRGTQERKGNRSWLMFIHLDFQRSLWYWWTMELLSYGYCVDSSGYSSGDHRIAKDINKAIREGRAFECLMNDCAGLTLDGANSGTVLGFAALRWPMTMGDAQLHHGGRSSASWRRTQDSSQSVRHYECDACGAGHCPITYISRTPAVAERGRELFPRRPELSRLRMDPVVGHDVFNAARDLKSAEDTEFRAYGGERRMLGLWARPAALVRAGNASDSEKAERPARCPERPRVGHRRGVTGWLCCDTGGNGVLSGRHGHPAPSTTAPK